MNPHRTSTLTAVLLTASITIAAATALTACGGGRPDDKTAIRQTFSALAHGLLAGDGHAVCSRMSASAIQSLAGDGILAGAGGSCPAVITIVHDDLGPGQRDALRHPRLMHLVVHGRQATATDNTGGSPDQFEKIDGRWYLSGDPG